MSRAQARPARRETAGPRPTRRWRSRSGSPFDPEGNLYVDPPNAIGDEVNDSDGRIGTVTAEIELPAAAAVDPSGRYLAVSTLGNYVHRIDLESGRVETVAGDGTPATTDGGPAAEARVEWPHGIAFDEAGNLYFPDGEGFIRAVDAESGVITHGREGQ